MLYDYRPIYEAFEKPIIDAEKLAAATAASTDTQKQSFKTIANLITTTNNKKLKI